MRTSSPGAPFFHFFGGKGGVGKTTCAAGAAVVAAETGGRVLAISVDPAHSLGDALAVPLSSKPRRIVTKRGSLFAVELDADAALARWLRKHAGVLRRVALRGTYLDEQDLERLLRLSLPGVDELMALLEINALSASYEHVVVDTAPTGHTLRLLAMPGTLQVIARVLDTMQAKHRFLAGSLGGEYRADETDAFIVALDREASEMAEVLRTPGRASFSWVSLPEALAAAETADAVAALDAAGMPIGEVIVNRITTAPPGPCGLCRGRMRTERPAIARLVQLARGRRVRAIAALETEPRGVAALRRFGAALARAPATLRASSKSAVRTPPLARSADRGSRAELPLSLPDTLRLLMFAGKGGVGKTTCAAAAAIRLASSSRRVLLLSADPAHSAGDALGIDADLDRERRVAGVPGLWVREIDAGRALERSRDGYRASVAELFDRLRGTSRFDIAYDRQVLEELIELTPPGIDELLALTSVVNALMPAPDSPALRAYNIVVLDMAPTGHALRLLEMPSAAQDWVRALLAIQLKYREVVGLGEFARELMTFSRQLGALQVLLTDRARTRAVVVTRPATLPEAETRRLIRALKRLRVPLGGIVVNAVTPPGCARCRRAARRERTATAAIASACRSLHRKACDIIVAPALAPPPVGRAMLSGWSQRWARYNPDI